MNRKIARSLGGTVGIQNRSSRAAPPEEVLADVATMVPIAACG